MDRTVKLQNIFDEIKTHCAQHLPNYILSQTGSLFTHMLMPWSDLNILVSLNNNSKHLCADEVLQQFLGCIQTYPGMIRDYKTIKNQSYGIIKVIFFQFLLTQEDLDQRK